MKRVGIVTIYYESENYGGLLQAFALTQYLINLGYDAQQISFSYVDASEINNDNYWKKVTNKLSHGGVPELTKSLLLFLKRRFIAILSRILCSNHISNNIKKRKYDLKTFRDAIPHSKNVYDESSINDCEDYDVYICGSDQVWNPAYCINGKLNPIFWLQFVNNKTKLSYASSPTLASYNKEYFPEIIKSLKDYSGISFREDSSVDFLNQIVEKDENMGDNNVFINNTKSVLDPVFLIDKNNWYEYTLEPCPVQGKFVFAYLLGEDKTIRKIIKLYCKQNNLTLVTFPHIFNNFRICDYRFADVDIYDDPRAFLSLIKNASLVVTDSFHAASFSIIFEKQFVCFQREAGRYGANNSRIIELLNKFELSNKFISIDNEISYEKFQDNIDSEIIYSNIKEKLNKEIQKSKDYLANSFN